MSEDIRQLELTIAEMQRTMRDLAGHAFLAANPSGVARLSAEDYAGNARVLRRAIEDLKRAAG